VIWNLPDRRRWAKLARYAAYAAAALAAAVIAAALVLPLLLDNPAVSAQLQQKLSAALRGKVEWESLSVRILPAPRGVVRKARIQVPGSLDVRADELAVRLAFWPLLRGRPEIVSVTLSRPAIVLDVPAAAGERDDRKEKDDGQGIDFASTYRSTAGAIADLVRRFAPDTTLSIENAELEFSAPGILPMALHDVSVRARTGHAGMNLDVSLAGTHWARIKMAARVQFADLSGNASIEAAGLVLQPWLDHYLAGSPVRVTVPPSDLRVEAKVDAKTALEGAFEVRSARVSVARGAQGVQVPDLRLRGRIAAGADEVLVNLEEVRLDAGRLTGTSTRYSVRSGSATVEAGFDIDTAQALAHARRLVPEKTGQVLAGFQPQGRAQGTVKASLGRPDWRVVVDVAKSDAVVQATSLPGPVRLAHGTVEIDRHAVTVHRAAASMPAGQVSLSTLRHIYAEGATTASAEFDADLAQGLELARRAVPEKGRDELAVVQSASGRARGTARLELGRKGWSVGVEIQKANAQVQVRGLPGPAGLTAGSVRVVPRTVTVERATVALLDGKATASATIRFDDGLRVEGSIAEGTIGAKLLEWAWQAAEVPSHMALKAPIHVTAPRFVWGPKRALDAQATARFPAGQVVAMDIAWAPDALQVRRAALKDSRSDAVFTARSAGARLDGGFSGSLLGSSIAALLKGTVPQEGGVSGKLRFAFDRDRPRDASAQGNLKGESLDLSWLAGQPVRIDRIDVAADSTSLRIREAAFNWAGQRATIRGEARRGAAGPVIDAHLDSSGINLDPLLEAGARAQKPAAAKRGPTSVWPLPVAGQLAVRADFVQRGRYRVAPFAGTLVLQQERAKIDLKEAQICGISVPLAVEATPAGLVATAAITAQKQQLQQAAHCLTDQRVLITGEFDLKADLSSHGKVGDLARNMKGSVAADMRDGRVMKFALLGNILSMSNIAALMKEGGPKLDAEGFPYRDLKIAGRFDAGRFVLDEGAFQSDAVGLAANGWISLTEPQSRLTVLVAPFSRLDQLVRKVPVFGYVVGGAFTSVPVGVSGDIRDPLVVPLGPAAIGSEVLGIFERTLKLPVELVTPRDKPAP
jgi:hypothetical protein